MSFRRKFLELLLSSSSSNNDLDGNWIFHNTVNIDTGEVTYFIFHNTKNCSLSNQQTTIVSGQTYTTEIIADTGKDISKLQLVVMYNGQDISSTCYDPVTHIITINNVQYNIDINAKIQGVPAEYTQYDWIASSGTEWINTQYIPNINSDTTIISQELSTSGTCTLFGNGNPRYHIDVYSGGWHFGVGSNWNVISQVDLLKHKFRLKMTGECFIDDILVDTLAAYSGTFTTASALFAKYLGSYLGTRAKMYYCKIEENAVKLRELYPAVRNSDSKPGMYDIVNDVFYTNSGTGEFTYGNDE